MKSIYTESIRLKKAIKYLLIDKMAQFPSFKQYHLPYTEKPVKFIKTGSIHVGVENYTNNGVFSGCRLEVGLSDLFEKLKNLQEKEGTENKEGTDAKEDAFEMSKHKFRLLTHSYTEDDKLVLSCEKYPSFEENKKWLKDTLSILVKESCDLTRDDFNNIPLPEVNEEVKTIDVLDTKNGGKKKFVRKVVSLDFPEEWKRDDMANQETERVKEIKQIIKN